MRQRCAVLYVGWCGSVVVASCRGLNARMGSVGGRMMATVEVFTAKSLGNAMKRVSIECKVTRTARRVGQQCDGRIALATQIWMT